MEGWWYLRLLGVGRGRVVFLLRGVGGEVPGRALLVILHNSIGKAYRFKTFW